MKVIIGNRVVAFSDKFIAKHTKEMFIDIAINDFGITEEIAKDIYDNCPLTKDKPQDEGNVPTKKKRGRKAKKTA